LEAIKGFDLLKHHSLSLKGNFKRTDIRPWNKFITLNYYEL